MRRPGPSFLPGMSRWLRGGWPRTYSREAMVAVDAYTRAVAAAALEARKVFREMRQEAKEEFRQLYPDGKLPDEENGG